MSSFFVPMAEGDREEVRVKVVEARRLSSSWGSVSAYVEIRVNGDRTQCAKTKPSPKTRNPLWNEEFTLFLSDTSEYIEVSVYEHRPAPYTRKVIGSLEIPIASLVGRPATDSVYTLARPGLFCREGQLQLIVEHRACSPTAELRAWLTGSAALAPVQAEEVVGVVTGAGGLTVSEMREFWGDLKEDIKMIPAKRIEAAFKNDDAAAANCNAAEQALARALAPAISRIERPRQSLVLRQEMSHSFMRSST